MKDVIHYLLIRNSDGVIEQRGFCSAEALHDPPEGYTIEQISPDDPRRPPAADMTPPPVLGMFDALYEAMTAGEIPKAGKFCEMYAEFRKRRIPP